MRVTPSVLAFLAASAASAGVLFLLGLHLDSFALRLACKPWPHLALVAWVASSAPGLHGRRMVAGLALCMAGDFLLEFRDTLFPVGMGFFLAGQLAFAFAFASRSRAAAPALCLPFVAWCGLLFALVAPGLGALRVPVALYTAAIATMMWRAAVLAASSSVPGVSGWIALAGAVVFGASDSLIAVDRFHGAVPGARFVIILTYWAALALLALSAVRAAAEDAAAGLVTSANDPGRDSRF